MKSNTNSIKSTNSGDNKQLKDILGSQIDAESITLMNEFYYNTPSRPGLYKGHNTLLQCKVFQSTMEDGHENISDGKRAYSFINHELLNLFNSIKNKLLPNYKSADAIKKQTNSLNVQGGVPSSISITDFEKLSILYDGCPTPKYPWCWQLDSYKFQDVNSNSGFDQFFTHMSKCTTDFVKSISTLFKNFIGKDYNPDYVVLLPVFLARIFDTILYYQRVYNELLSIVKNELQGENVINMIIRSGFNPTTYNINIKNIGSEKTVKCLFLEQEVLTQFALALIDVVFNRFVSVPKNEIAGLFNYTNYVNYGSFVNYQNSLFEQHENKYKQGGDLVMYRIYIICQKICKFLPRMVSCDPDINKKQEYYYFVLNKSYIAEKAVDFFKNELWSIEMERVQIKNKIPKKQVVQSKVRRSNLLLKPDISIPASKDYKPQMFVTKKMVKQIRKINGKKGIQFSKTTHPNHTNSNETKSAMKGGVK